MLKKADISEKLKAISTEVELRDPIRLAGPHMTGSTFKSPVSSDISPGDFLEKIDGIEGFLLREKDGLEIKTTYREIEKGKLDQVFILDKDGPVELKWTVVEDPFADEFTLLTQELKLVKDTPPIYASEFRGANIVTSHVGLYTLILGSYELDIDDLVKTFLVLLKILSPSK